MAVEAWERWREVADLDRLDHGSYRLLPLLHETLQREGICDPVQATFRDAYRHTSIQNQLRFRDLKIVAGAFDAGGIPIVLLKGAALIAEYYESYGSRPMDDIDVLVPTEGAEEAIAILGGLDWVPADTLTEKRLRTLHGIGFHDADGRKIDLHWHLTPETGGPGGDDRFWQRARPVTLAGVTALALHPSDLLFHVCAHGIKWNRIPPVRWVADASAILAESSVEMDWEWLLAAAERYRLVLPIREALRYLSERLDAPIPADVLDRLDRMPVSRTERLEYRFRIAPAPHPLLGYMPEYWFNWLRASGDVGLLRKLIGFPGYLQDRFESGGLFELASGWVTRWARRGRAMIWRAAGRPPPAR
jgi:hypothetical protein